MLIYLRLISVNASRLQSHDVVFPYIITTVLTGEGNSILFCKQKANVN